ncbi:MAG: phosphatase PAP2 family protein [Gemmatimonadota bacterium]|nr:phosphatase PAP2 family protein [Gemmatimonadota bacterium]
MRRRIHPRRSAALTSIANGISYLAGPRTHPYTAAVLGLLINRRERRGGFGPSAASLGALAVDNVTRVFVHQRRPPMAGRHRGRNRYGYPSGHTTAATAIAIASATEIEPGLSVGERRLLWSVVTAISIAAGWSRLYLDEHWIDDVVGGWMAGIAIGLGSASVVELRD